MVKFLASLLLLPGTGAVVMFPHTPSFSAEDATSRTFSVEDATPQILATEDAEQLFSAVPNISMFKKVMEEFDAKVSAEALEMPKAGGVRLLIGVQALAKDSLYRQVHRDTWMKRKGVCGVDMSNDKAPPKGDCHVFYTFISGKSKNQAEDSRAKREAAEKGDMTVPFFPARQLRVSKGREQCFELDAANTTYTIADPDLPKSGELHDKQVWINVKNQGWMHFTTDHYRWATHIGVMDLDTYPRVEKVLNDMRDPDHSNWAHTEIKPKGWSEKKGGMYYGAKCGGLKGKAQGAFVGFSRSTLECMYNLKNLKYNFIDYINGAVADDNMASLVRQAMADGCPETWWVGPAACQGDRWRHPMNR